MELTREHMDVPSLKDPTAERPIPSAWRPIIREIVSAFVRQDYSIKAGIPGVLPVTDETAEHIRKYLRSYGEVLVDLPEETWNSSVCIWMGHRWEALIDLWTAAEGRSDLAMSLHVREAESAPQFEVVMVYVP